MCELGTYLVCRFWSWGCSQYRQLLLGCVNYAFTQSLYVGLGTSTSCMLRKTETKSSPACSSSVGLFVFSLPITGSEVPYHILYFDASLCDFTVMKRLMVSQSCIKSGSLQDSQTCWGLKHTVLANCLLTPDVPSGEDCHKTARNWLKALS